MIIKHPLPLKDFDYIGQHHYRLTWCCDFRRRQFTQADRVNLVLQQFLRACRESGFEIIAYCFMPDHVHQLVRGASISADGHRYIKLAKQYSGYYFSCEYHEKLWQRYGHDSWLQDENSIRAAAAYILENPVKDKLVERVEDYPFIGSCTMSLEELIEWIRER